ncbi:MAG: LysM peptidoglycan-binding domain-containing protein [Clostridia bacterium]|nr:LysM peptidoglycan-binding domain-containing protein [Clostridia bacterium]
MAYKMYLAGELMPVTPERVTIKIKNRNESMTLISGEEINLIKSRGLCEVSFTLLLPQSAYPFSLEKKPPKYYISLFARLKENKSPFQWILNRTKTDGRTLFYTNMTVSLEDYTLTDDAADGFDVRAALKLRQYKIFGTKKVSVSGGKAYYDDAAARESANAPAAASYTVKRGDSLWNIAKKELGDGSRYKEIYELNRDKISNPSLIYPGQVLILPRGA